MIIIVVFVALVFLYSLVSRRLERAILTPPIFFTSAGVLLIFVISGHHEIDMQRETFLKLAELGLVMILFTDASHIDLKILKSSEKLPLRLLSIGMLLTILLGAAAARLVFPRLSIWEAGILAAILAPTDAGLGQVIVRSPLVPPPIRQSLDVEAGLNDGLSVPFLMFFIAVSQVGSQGAGSALLNYIFEQLGMGALVGLAVGLIGGLLLGKARRKEWMAESAQQLGLVALPVLSIFACRPVGGVCSSQRTLQVLRYRQAFETRARTASNSARDGDSSSIILSSLCSAFSRPWHSGSSALSTPCTPY
jgi:NhaP-type Na+/H+ or K+/H+ antiporter